MTDSRHPLRLFNSLSRQLEEFSPIHPGEARVYSCGPTVYNYPHIGNMRAYVFADTLGRTLCFKGYSLTHVINITDVGHLTSDADAGPDKMEKAAAEQATSIWDIARHYTEAYWRDVERLNIRQPAKWSIATDHIAEMIRYAEKIAPEHCYELESGLYFDVSTVPDYGRLARAATEDGASRIDPVDGKRNAADFAIWRKSSPDEHRQMEWDSPWGRGAPGWHLECSVMSQKYLGDQFDIHTGGIDHREIHHPNEIAQNQAHSCSSATGANFWMHNNFLVERDGKMSKSSGEFLTLQRLIDRGFHPLAYRLLCLQAHYRSELEFSWPNLTAALTRLKRMIMAFDRLIAACDGTDTSEANTQHPRMIAFREAFEAAMSDDLNTPKALTVLEEVLSAKKLPAAALLDLAKRFDQVLGLDLGRLSLPDLRIRPKDAQIAEEDIVAVLSLRKDARAKKDFATSDTLRDQLAAQGVEVMDGDPLGWEWRLD